MLTGWTFLFHRRLYFHMLKINILRCISHPDFRPGLWGTLMESWWNHHGWAFLFPELCIFVCWKSIFCNLFPTRTFDPGSEEHWLHLGWTSTMTTHFATFAVCYGDCETARIHLITVWPHSSGNSHTHNIYKCIKTTPSVEFREHLTSPGLEKKDIGGSFQLLFCVSDHNLYFLWTSILSESQCSPTLRARAANVIGWDGVIFRLSNAKLEVFGSAFGRTTICVLQYSSV